MTRSKFYLPRYDQFTAKPGFFLAQVVCEYGVPENTSVIVLSGGPVTMKTSIGNPKEVSPKL